ncbi:XkdX family protein [Bacillus spizizenii]|uniref:XkdX family protein n=1 Tax=Bacillus spizizenii TaxID=96241 RepID=UPI000AFB2B24|nr:XkdX family protein [Bacillus spizizenii]MCY7971027.1 XkdX family protein [Bacillus spizizenii]MCY7988548.1 XkdX family protein [Bacillus spizizenii]MCY8052186.1 XkdX family protein [Bacillus spizizenii]MCY8646950.1 XkdX family protein [Bacillus spizizenii]MCY8805780.1 XkdX family protein [Bacillus spizizenii]
MESQSTLYGFFEDCWRNGTVLTIEMKQAVIDKRITQLEYDQITAMERGNAYPDQV